MLRLMVGSLVLAATSLPVLAEEKAAEHESRLASAWQNGVELAEQLIAPAEAEPFWYVQTSVYTRHWSPEPDHNNNQDLIGLERHRADSYLWGASTFRHSFGVRSTYVYGGKRYDFAGTPFHAKVTAGLLHGYRNEYRDKIPLNRFGIAPAIIPSLGVNYGRVGADFVVLGTAAAMINVGVRL